MDRMHLESLNLIRLFHGGQIRICPFNGYVPLSYHGKSHRLRHQDPCRPLELAADLLTDIGRELAPISGARPNPEFEALMLRALPGGFIIES